MGNKGIQRPESEDLTSGGQKKLLHVFASDPESSTGYAGNYLELRRVLRSSSKTEGGEVLNAGDLISGRAVVFGELW